MLSRRFTTASIRAAIGIYIPSFVLNDGTSRRPLLAPIGFVDAVEADLCVIDGLDADWEHRECPTCHRRAKAVAVGSRAPRRG